MLNNNQKKYLKSLSNSDEILKFNIGKEVLTKNSLIMLDNALTKHELIKISFLKSSLQNADKKQIILDILSNLNSKLVQEIGNTIIIYRANPKLSKRINLPK